MLAKQVHRCHIIILPNPMVGTFHTQTHPQHLTVFTIAYYTMSTPPLYTPCGTLKYILYSMYLFRCISVRLYVFETRVSNSQRSFIALLICTSYSTTKYTSIVSDLDVVFVVLIMIIDPTILTQCFCECWLPFKFFSFRQRLRFYECGVLRLLGLLMIHTWAIYISTKWCTRISVTQRWVTKSWKKNIVWRTAWVQSVRTYHIGAYWILKRKKNAFSAFSFLSTSLDWMLFGWHGNICNLI